MLPARALGHKDITLKDTLHKTRWNFWRILWAGALCSIIGSAATFSLHSAGCDMDPTPASAIYAFAQTLNVFLILPVFLAYLSLCYKHFFEYGQPDSAAVQGTPRFPLKTLLFACFALLFYAGWHMGAKAYHQELKMRQQQLANPAPAPNPYQQGD